MSIYVRSARYTVSFTCGALLAHESVRLAELYHDTGSWEEVRKQCLSSNILQASREKTLERITQEIIARLKKLHAEELHFLVRTEYSEQKYVLWLAVCRRYPLIGDFAREVLHEFYVSGKRTLTVDDYAIFLAGKASCHEELQKLSQTTRNKARQTLFSMMREAGLLEGGEVVPCMPREDFLLLLRQNREDALFFPLPRGLCMI